MKIRILLSALVLAFASGCDNTQSPNKEKHEVPEPNSAGGKIFKKFCGNCHAPPRIKSHKADEWRNVVERMQNHRLKKAYSLLNDSEKETLLSYLQKHSAAK